MSDAPQQPTPAETQAAAEVSQAVGAAAAAAPTAEQARHDAAAAARATAERVNLEIPEEAIQQIANGVVNAMEVRGAFDAPPEPVQAPPSAPPAPGEPPVAAETPQVPQKRSFAQRFLGE